MSKYSYLRILLSIFSNRLPIMHDLEKKQSLNDNTDGNNKQERNTFKGIVKNKA